MIGPLDTQVLVNRTLDVQKNQGNAIQVLEDEEQIRKERQENQIVRDEQRVKRKSEIVQGRIQDQGKERERNTRQNKKDRNNKTAVEQRKGRGKDQNEWRGRFVDLEL